jgi:4-amino-4-deoxy-L-arabinose transferase-like glycosyltransferase
MVDFGREVYLPWRIQSGDVLYTDIGHLFGPLSPYLNAFWMNLFGNSIDAVFTGNILLTAFFSILIVIALRKCSGALASIIGALAFILIFAFAQYTTTGNYNFIAPYAHQLTHGLILSFVTLLVLERGLRTTSVSTTFCAGFCLGLTILTKGEVSFALLVATLCSFCLHPFKSRFSNSTAILGLTFCISAMIPTTIAVVCFAPSLTPQEAILHFFASYPGQVPSSVVSLPFYQEMSGLDSAGDNLRTMILWACIYLAYFTPLAIVALCKKIPASIHTATAITYLLGTSYLIQNCWSDVARAYPLLLLAAIVLLGRKWLNMRKAGKSLDTVSFSITFCVFAFVLMLKLLLHVKLTHYGFALALPATLVVIAALTDWIPKYIASLGGNKQCFQLGAVFVIFAVSAQYLQLELAIFERKTGVITSNNDQFYSDDLSHLVNASLNEVESTLGEKDTLAVLPEGVFLNFLLRRKNTTPFLTLMPPELLIHGEQHIVDSFDASPPDYILLVNKDTSEYGARFFGVDYGQSIGDWVKQNYESVSIIGQQPFVNEKPGALLLKRKRPATKLQRANFAKEGREVRQIPLES